VPAELVSEGAALPGRGGLCRAISLELGWTQVLGWQSIGALAALVSRGDKRRRLPCSAFNARCSCRGEAM